VVKDLNFDLWTGQVLGLVGESGSGKTQAFLAIMGLLARNGRAEGRALLGDVDLLQLKPRALNRMRGREIAMVFQDTAAALNPTLRIGIQMAEVLALHHAVPLPQAELAAIDMLDMVGISDPERRARCYPHELSGGMRQRVLIGMALMCRPKVLIADEATASLDATVQAQILTLFKTVCDRLGTALVLITHDLSLAASIADRMMVMYAGQAVEIATTDALFHDPRHPYTRGLLASTPAATVTRGKLYTIPGPPPRLLEGERGCRFNPRCPHRAAHCVELAPILRPVALDHQVACHFDIGGASQ
jgi:oligopeptide transport system ATP-binding protein